MTGRTTLTNRFDEALTYTREHHRDDWRKGTDIPYVSHLLGICSLVLDMEGTDGDALWTRFSAGRDEQLWYYGALADRFSARRADLGEPAGPLVDELQRVVAEIGRVSAGGEAPRARRQIGPQPNDSSA